MTFSYAYSFKSNEVTLTNCDREPVHVPGVIQPHGVLLALRTDDLTILQVSDNTAQWLGHAPEDLLGTTLGTLAGDANAKTLAEMVAQGKLESLPRYVFTHDFGTRKLDMLAHTHDGLVIIEAEASDLAMATPAETLYAEVSRITGRLQKARGLQPFCQSLADEIRGLTGLDRVMIYRFHEDNSGEVFAEARREDLHTYMTLRYPAEDIPQPAREIFRKIWVRPVPSISYEASEVTPLLNPDTKTPLDMTYCFLRGASVMYTDYLKNMGVAMALTLSIVVEGKLWGLVACHHNTPKIVPWPMRAACELLAQVASLQLKSAENAEFAQYREAMTDKSQRLIEYMLAEGRELPDLMNNEPGLLGFFSADGVAMLVNGKWYSKGYSPKGNDLKRLGEWVAEQYETTPLGTEILHTHALGHEYPPAASYAADASGLLAMPISRNRENLVLWFRRETVQTVNWAGDPYSKPVVDGPGGPRLLPRSSFALWQESVSGQSDPWKPLEVEAARRLRLALMEVVAARTEQVSRLNHELSLSNAELDAFAYGTSHDLREPLRGIYHYAYQLNESALEREDAAAVSQSESLMRLTKRMDALIESLLQFSRVGRTTLYRETLDMPALAQEAVEILYASVIEKKPVITIDPAMPPAKGDAVRVREVLVNLVGNALKYSDKDKVIIDIGYEATPEGNAYFVRDNGIGISTEHFAAVFDLFKRLHARDKFGGGTGAGLTIVKKIIERHDGKIDIASELGKGTTFRFTLGNGEDE